MDRNSMVAPGSGPVPEGASVLPAVLSRSTLMAVRRVLHAYREGWVLERGLRRAAHAVAVDAHRHALPPERMLVAVKSAWASLPEVHQLTPDDDSRDLASRFFTLCIEEFFAVVRAWTDPDEWFAVLHLVVRHGAEVGGRR